ncbi:MAG: sodium:proton antiporter [Rickettsiales bacterium]|nr:MAG: sodium:proton antiporter [Rickettsiales bacterium]
MSIFLNFMPILLFITIFFGSGIYYTYQGVDQAFYQVPPTSAIIPSIIIAWILHKKSTTETMNSFINGIRHPDIITMCIIFLLAGALGSVTKSIGSVESCVNFILNFTPSSLLLIGIFITSALISTAIGTSMGTIAALASLITELGNIGAFPLEIGAATLIGGAMFGDNMSVISDTTIAAVSSQGADLREKLKLNIKIALVASLITIIYLSSINTPIIDITDKEFSLLLISPYILLILLAAIGINVFIVLIVALIYSGIIGISTEHYSLLMFSKDIYKGFSDMNEILLLSMFIGGLSGLSNHNSKIIAEKISKLLPINAGIKSAKFIIMLLVSLYNILLANNVIAIIFSGEVAKEIAKKYNIKPHVSATILDIFSCVIQGIIPYGAQVLLICAIANISPLDVIGKIYYCYTLAVVTIIYILLPKAKTCLVTA